MFSVDEQLGAGFLLTHYHFSISLVSRISTKTPFTKEGVGGLSVSPST